jgi:hypothetical protein
MQKFSETLDLDSRNELDGQVEDEEDVEAIRTVKVRNSYSYSYVLLIFIMI